MHVGIWHQSTLPLCGATPRRNPSGGTETALVYTAEALARAGVRVTVFCNTDEESTTEGVTYVPGADLHARLAGREFDAFLVVRHLAAFTVPVRTRGVFYWSHDNLAQPFLHGMFRFFAEHAGGRRLTCALHLGELMGHIDAVFAVSRWQAGAIAAAFGVLPARIEVVGNGLPPGLFSPTLHLASKRPIILYSLPPDRGMLPLLEIFAKASPRLDGAELHLYSSSTIYGAPEKKDEAAYGEVYALARRIGGVHHFAPIPQSALAKAMERAMVYAYPTATEETFCISILEAQAAGAVPVSSACGAIPERVTPGVDGFLIPGDPAGEEYQRAFVDKLVRLRRDPELRHRIAAAAHAKAHSAEYCYDTVARRMLARVEETIRGRPVRETWFDVARLAPPYVTPTTAPEAAPPRELRLAELCVLRDRFCAHLRLGQRPA
ncbi:MAG: glycosyltransferase family 4 protein [Planctomycetota bacterium]